MDMAQFSGYKVTVLKSQAKSRRRKSLWGVKSRVSGKNRKGQVAHGVGSMDSNIIMADGVMRN